MLNNNGENLSFTPGPDAEINSADHSGAVVLIVDDMEINLYSAASLMREYQIASDCVTGAEEAINRIRKGTPRYDAVFMDHMMPEIDGVEALKAIRSLDSEYARSVPIIALTSSAEPGIEQQYIRHGFQDFLPKPIEAARLEAILDRFLGHKAAGISPDAPCIPPACGDIIIDIPGLDSREGLSRYGGKPDIYASVLRAYAISTPQHLNKLRRVTEETLPESVTTVHGLKGAGANICAENAAAAAVLEKAARNGDLEGFSAIILPFIEDTERLIYNIKSWLEIYDENIKKPRQKAPDGKVLAKLRQSCEEYDMSGIDEAMDELERVNYDTGGELVAWLREKIDIMEVGQVIARLAAENY